MPDVMRQLVSEKSGVETFRLQLGSGGENVM